MQNIISRLAQELNMREAYVANVVALMDEGNTIPFIARYRKEAHGTADDTTLRKLEERLNYLRGLEERKGEVLRLIEERGALTNELKAAVENAQTLAEVEDLYRPYKQKRRTRASMAKEKGLEPLADRLFAVDAPDPMTAAREFINPEKGVETAEEALAGAADIIAERLSDDAAVRGRLRTQLNRTGALCTKAAEDENGTYAMYADFSRPLSRLAGHQILAMNRGEKEGALKVTLQDDREAALNVLERVVVPNSAAARAFVDAAAEDAYDRLIQPSLERETRAELTDKAAEGAIANFAVNLKNLLMQPPVKGHVTMGLDPGYAHGCKVAVVDAHGRVLDTTVVYPTHGERGKREAIARLSAMMKKHGVEHIAIGNGTASRETEQMAAEMLRGLDTKASYMVVSEAGASVYSASEIAAEEFPDYDVNLRSAVSIARRMQDPLAELVKIEPQAIGVGQYQHDMPQKRLAEALGHVVEDCVNAVGVDLNTASASLLGYVSGLNKTLAKNIVAYKEENGAFTSRKQLLKVAKLGPKAYKQCAGFLRVAESKEPLDNTGVHPESYDAAKALLTLCGFDAAQMRGGKAVDLTAAVKARGEAACAEACGVGVPTLRDIVEELKKPGRDPRDELPAPILRSDVTDAKDLKPGMELMGTVRNVIDFGAFVDIGVHRDGLVHISQICNHFLRHPSEVLKVGDVVKVRVLEVDEKKNRISLTMRDEK